MTADSALWRWPKFGPNELELINIRRIAESAPDPIRAEQDPADSAKRLCKDEKINNRNTSGKGEKLAALCCRNVLIFGRLQWAVQRPPLRLQCLNN